MKTKSELNECCLKLTREISNQLDPETKFVLLLATKTNGKCGTNMDRDVLKKYLKRCGDAIETMEIVVFELKIK